MSTHFEIGGVECPGLADASESDGDIEVVALGARRDWRNRPRNRGAVVAATAGSLWAVLVQQMPEGGRQIFGVAQLQWAFTDPEYHLRRRNDCGSLNYTAHSHTTFLLVEPIAIDEALDIERPTATVVAMAAIAGRSRLKVLPTKRPRLARTMRTARTTLV